MRRFRWTHYLGAAGLISAGRVAAAGSGLGVHGALLDAGRDHAGGCLQDHGRGDPAVSVATPRRCRRQAALYLRCRSGWQVELLRRVCQGVSAVRRRCACPRLQATSRSSRATITCGSGSIRVSRCIATRARIPRASRSERASSSRRIRRGTILPAGPTRPSRAGDAPPSRPRSTIAMPPNVELDGLAVANGFGFVDAATHLTLYAAPPAAQSSRATGSRCAPRRWRCRWLSSRSSSARRTARGSGPTRARRSIPTAGDYAPGEVNGIFTGDKASKPRSRIATSCRRHPRFVTMSGRGPLLTTSKGQTLYSEARYRAALWRP